MSPAQTKIACALLLLCSRGLPVGALPSPGAHRQLATSGFLALDGEIDYVEQNPYFGTKDLCAINFSTCYVSSEDPNSSGSGMIAWNKGMVFTNGPAFTYLRTDDTTEPYGPSEWHLGYEHCNGSSQSPINLSASKQQSEHLPIKFYPAACESQQLNFTSGDHFFKVSLEACDEVPSVEFQGSMYEVLQMHIHSASEHTIGGSHHDAEVHLVHVKEGTDDELLVIGVLMDASEHGENMVIKDVWNTVKVAEGWSMPNAKGMVDLYDLLPATPSFATYNGSLTTPPCTEGVTWIVMTDTTLISEYQLQEYRYYVAGLEDSMVSEFGDTNRPTQPRNGRIIKYSR